jgi:hyperosmotically inducible protein
MNKMSMKIILTSLVLVGFYSASGIAQTNSDNSQTNIRDRKVSEVTADQQKINKVDESITLKIRQDLMKQKSLSVNAKNVKIISINGKVTLKGPVDSKKEELMILKFARIAAGKTMVENEMSILPNKE